MDSILTRRATSARDASVQPDGLDDLETTGKDLKGFGDDRSEQVDQCPREIFQAWSSLQQYLPHVDGMTCFAEVTNVRLCFDNAVGFVRAVQSIIVRLRPRRAVDHRPDDRAP